MTNTATPPGDTYTDRVRSDIRAEMGRRQLTQTQLGKLMRRTPDWISDRIGGSAARVAFSLSDIEEFARAFDVDPSEFGRRA